jgi:hypothetical protein
MLLFAASQNFLSLSQKLNRQIKNGEDKKVIEQMMIRTKFWQAAALKKSSSKIEKIIGPKRVSTIRQQTLQRQDGFTRTLPAPSNWFKTLKVGK